MSLMKIMLFVNIFTGGEVFEYDEQCVRRNSNGIGFKSHFGTMMLRIVLRLTGGGDCRILSLRVISI